MTQTAQKNCRRSLRNVTARIEGNLPANSIAEPGAKKGLCASRAGDLPLAPALALHKRCRAYTSRGNSMPAGSALLCRADSCRRPLTPSHWAVRTAVAAGRRCWTQPPAWSQEALRPRASQRLQRPSGTRAESLPRLGRSVRVQGGLRTRNWPSGLYRPIQAAHNHLRCGFTMFHPPARRPWRGGGLSALTQRLGLCRPPSTRLARSYPPRDGR